MSLSTPLRAPGLQRKVDFAWIAAILYVAAWLVGLVAAPPAPPISAEDAEFTTYLDAHGGAAVIQSLLVHGLAGLALAAVVARAASAAAGRSLRTAVRVAGLGAVAVSLFQVVLMVAAVNARSGAAGWFQAINLADSVKLVLIAAFAAAVRVGTALPGRTVRFLAPIVVVVLTVSALAFPLRSTALYGLLYLALPLLLAFVFELGRTLPRGR